MRVMHGPAGVGAVQGPVAAEAQSQVGAGMAGAQDCSIPNSPSQELTLIHLSSGNH